MRHHVPAETVANEINEAASILEIGAKRIVRFGRVVFGVLDEIAHVCTRVDLSVRT